MSIEVSKSAIARIARILKNESNKNALRISVEGGGCSGFSYRYDLVCENPHEDDLVIMKDGAIIYIDSLSLPFMEGSQIDFVDDLMGQSFQINNPNAVSSCGCGTSFSI
ncbi:HesB/IscA family protein [Bartonella tamiae]|uniref:Iron-sulfur cluster assembly accessory protein n=1 Tax=Bartonella tamiae Th239 TaxID=1094558 RepID=J1JWA7_9HYPH|nr:iron-sulfur cluster assembly accessory protein [Bartonella tamiae]EJF88870.1 iron-sulfur cluster assembly accessory protein [Bartonella tamiae Th239]EJF94880.1 iron-sulfur cluster assembly accessory protein [Bartonella tamiae Th307]